MPVQLTFRHINKNNSTAGVVQVEAILHEQRTDRLHFSLLKHFAVKLPVI